MNARLLYKRLLVFLLTPIMMLFIYEPLRSQGLMSGCESVAYDSVYSRYLVSSLLNQKIIAIDKEGNQSIFKESIPSFGNCVTDSVFYVAGGSSVRGLDLETGELVMNVNFPGSTQLDGVTVDKNGFLYVVATRNDKIFKLNLADKTQTVLVDGGLSNAPQDIIYDDTRNRLLVCHFKSNAPIIAIDPDTGAIDTVAILEAGYSDGITADAEGNIYVTSYDDGGKIYIYDGDFVKPPAIIATDVGEPSGIDVNRIDNVLAVPNFAGNSVSFIQLPAVYLNASINADIKTGHAPFEVQFADFSSANPGIISWKWDFENDGVIDSEEQNPEWTYDEPGIYTVKLILESDSLMKEVLYEEYIHVFNGKSAIEIPGSGSYVIANPSETLTLGTEWTLEGWVKPFDMNRKNILDNGVLNLFTNRSASSAYRANSLGVRINMKDGSSVRFSTSDSSITQDTWNHFAFSYNYTLGFLKVYINGDEELLTVSDSALLAQPLTLNNDSPFIIGNSITFIRGLVGVIDELRLWNIARSGEEIRTDMEEYLTGNENGLTAYWKMDEGNGNNIIDLTGNENTGILSECNYSEGIDFSVFTSIQEKSIEAESMPLEYQISQNYPNPFNPETSIEFQIPEKTNVFIAVYNISGELIKTLADGEFGAGSNRVAWNGRNDSGVNVSSGIYFYRFTSGSFWAMKKMLLLR
jgi:PKD repeat protein